jgi:hypothetical protein
MQCVSCRFENIPGVESCGRCGSALLPGRVVVDVQPPRATALQKRLRQFFPFRWARASLRNTTGMAMAAARPVAEAHGVTLPPASVLIRLAVPGLAHFYTGEAFAGRCILGVYVPLMLLAALFFGTRFGGVLLGLAISVHCAGALHVLLRNLTTALTRLLVAVLVPAAIGAGIYAPAYWAVTRVALPITVAEASEPLQRDDMLLSNQLAYAFNSPAPGDVVRYYRARIDVAARVGGNPYPVIFGEGEQVDRILAVPGARVEFKDGRLTINGVESDVRPLNARHMPRAFSLTVPSECFLIFPSTLPSNVADLGDVWRRICIVREPDIRGRVYWRNQPLSRFGPLR